MFFKKEIRMKNSIGKSRRFHDERVGINVDFDYEEDIEQYVSDMIDWLKVHDGKMPSGKSKDKDEAGEQKQRLIDAGVPASVFLSQEEEIEQIVWDVIDWLKVHDGKMPSGKSNDKDEAMLYQRFKYNKTKFTEEQKQRLILVSDVIDWLKAHDGNLPSGKSNDKDEAMLYQRFKTNITIFTGEQKNKRLIAGNVPAEALEKKTRVTIKPEDANKVLKQKTKADEKDGGITQ